ncbi:MAG TPA: threonine synthase [Vicinamibacterales bacterium]|nr:threonine synthase [Vicinamibacterales bacterium]
MKFLSTRGRGTPAGLSAAIRDGIAADGGLFVPERIPALAWTDWPAAIALPGLAERVIAPFAEADPLSGSLAAICQDAFTFPAPLVPLRGADGDASALELFHGPTCAFKDFGARFLAAALERVRQPGAGRITILVATSGDTGGAVAAAFHRRPWVDVVLLYPRGLVSQRQAHQLSCWGGNVRTFAVEGTFDDCQRMVKEAFKDPALSARHRLSSANSINAGRLLPQMVYYAAASLEIWHARRRKASFIVPSGNLGNVTACVWARAAGLPIGDIVLATNANRTITEFLDSGVWRPRASVATLASAMDVGDPSNMERLRALLGDELPRHLTARLVTDDEIRRTIREDAATLSYVWDPHGATAASVYRQLPRERRDEPWVLVATAHPAKFNDIVEPLIGREVPVPGALARLLDLPRQEEVLPASLDALRARLDR